MSGSGQSAYFSPKLEVRPCKQKGGLGVFAVEAIPKDEVLVVWGGDVMTQERMAELPLHLRHLSIQVEEDLFLVSGKSGPGDRTNHSCDPNAGLRGQIVLVAFKNISPEDEICFDYAMSDASDYDEFKCSCGSPQCRGIIRGTDWRLPELWEKYKGYFSPYIQRRIDKSSVRK